MPLLRHPQSDPYSAEWFDLQDTEEIASHLLARRSACEAIQQQLRDIEQRQAELLAVLTARDSSEIPPPHNVSVNNLFVEPLNKWASLKTQLSLHKLLGAEFIYVSKDTILFSVQCKEDNYPTLPEKKFRITRIPNSNSYRLAPKEISYYSNYSNSLTQLMMKSSFEDMTRCFQSIQSLTFDLVARENIYNFMRSQELIGNSLVCSNNRLNISFHLPLHVPVSSNVPKSVTVSDLCSNNISLVLLYTGKVSGWEAGVYNPSSADSAAPPYKLEGILTEFFSDIKEQPLKDCLRRLLDRIVETYQTVRRPNSTTSSDDIAPDEFAFF